eukprot:scaffold12307_cov43-Attheya_sp.AAC.1
MEGGRKTGLTPKSVVTKLTFNRATPMFQQWKAAEKQASQQQQHQPHYLKGSIKSSSSHSTSNSNSNNSDEISDMGLRSANDDARLKRSVNSEGSISNPESASHSSSSNAMGSVSEYGIAYERPLGLGGAPNNASLPHDHGELFPRSRSDGQLHHQYHTHPSHVTSHTQGTALPPPPQRYMEYNQSGPQQPHPQPQSQQQPQQPFMPGYYYYVCDGKVYVPASPPQPVSSLYAGQDVNPSFPSHPESY